MLHEHVFLALGPYPWVPFGLPMLEDLFGRDAVPLLRLALRRRQRPLHLPAEPGVVLDTILQRPTGSTATRRFAVAGVSTVAGVALGVAGRPTGLTTIAIVCVVAAILAALAQQTLP